ncbi:N-glycosidase [Trichinella spiralis]|uniref:N-glycosidase n=1 Tax=Trichinella spiralis TaxID=6334 RepID=A0ABR3KAD4_TRISP
MKCNDKQIELLLTTSNPTYLPVVAKKALSKQESLLNDCKLFVNWLEQGLFLKFQQYPSAVRLLMSTGDSLLVETICGKRDCFFSCGMTEDGFSEFLAVSSVSVHEVFKKMVKPTSVCEKQLSCVGRNFSGLTLMRYRQFVCRKKAGAHSDNDKLHSSVENEGNNVATTKNEAEDFSFALSATTGPLDRNLYPFTRRSVLHPQYYAPIIQKDTAIIYPSAYHMVFMESCLYFGFPSKARAILARESSKNLFALFNSFISPCRLKFEQHGDLREFLKQTGKALLVYCNRLTTGMLNLSVGMCVDDFLNWKKICRVDNVKLAREMRKPYDKRLCYLGGNRLGFLLMELRKEIINSENKLTSDESSFDMTMEEALGLTYDDCGADEASYGAPIQLWRNPYDLLMMSIEEKLKGLAGESTAAVSSACSPKLSKYSAVSKFRRKSKKTKR